MNMVQNLIVMTWSEMELKDDRLSLAGAKVPPGDDFPGSPCIGLAEWSIPRIPFFRIHAILA